ncbi:LysR family transcriptional regulator [Vibrio panuliri]|uniref:LysR family transcriptional regulator n=1 Tax=Vibrio panuliri TaxID=1381081 RepID=A0ABX3FHT1_9VIBR|nr:LysR family transcriptional regulator [Vibrio panuliri]KAB1457819.1 LysR family transcriptional regulator [Vibrio panuliri]OLQ91081.1 LysR family transcriptional regulator [Vibrio panuliri]
MNGTTYNQLVMFHTIVHEGSISGAARKLEVAPPSVSQALKSLEEHLGLPLFTRTTRKMELTQAGQQLVEKTRFSMDELSHAIESVSDLSKVPSGKVRITMPRFAYQIYVQPIYAEFCQLYPDIELEISVSDATVDILSQGFDLGIRFGDKVEDGMVARPLTPPLKEAIVASPAYIAQHGLPTTPSELSKHKFVQYRFITSNQLAPLRLNDHGEVLNLESHSAIIVNDTDLLIDATLKGLGLCRAITPMVDHYIESQQLQPIMSEYWYTYAGLYVYFHRNSQKARRVRVLIDFLLDKIAQGATI